MLNTLGDGSFEVTLPITMSTKSYGVLGTYYVDADTANYTYAFKVRLKDFGKIKVYQNTNSSIYIYGY